MVGARGPPPPPPLSGGQIQVDGPPMEGRPAQRVQPQQGQQQQRQQQQQQQQQEQQQRAFQFARAMPMMNGAGYISDIRPVPQLTESQARQELTVYEVWTLRKAEPPRQAQNPSGSSESSKSKKSSSPKATWGQAVVSKDSFDQNDIIRKIKNLDKNGRSVTSRKENLRPNQQQQIASLLQGKLNGELDRSYTWTLAQLHQKIVRNRRTGARETEVLTVYLKRAPAPFADAIALCKAYRERQKIMARPQEQTEKNQGDHIGPKEGGGNGAFKGGKGGVVVVEDHRRAKSPAARRRVFRDSDSDSSVTDSDSDASYSSESDTSYSSVRSRRRRDSSHSRKEPRRYHEREKGYMVVGDGDRRRRHSMAYAVPDPPRGGRAPSYERTSMAGMGVDPIAAEAFAAGIAAASNVAAANRLSSISPRAIMYPRQGSRYPFDDSLRRLSDLDIHDDRSIDEYSSRGAQERRDEMYLDNLRREDRLRRAVETDDRYRPDPLSISPRTRFVPRASIRRGSLSPLPLDEVRAFDYVRNPNPMAPRRESYYY